MKKAKGKRQKAKGKKDCGNFSHFALYLLSFVFCLLLLVGCDAKKPKEEHKKKPLIPVNVRVVEQYLLADSGTRYSANIQPYTQVDLAFKVGGYIQEILQVKGVDGQQRNIQEGDWVIKGTILARVRDTDYIVKVNQARSQLAEVQATSKQAKYQLAQTQATLEQVRLEFDRATNLFRTQSITKSDYDAAKARFETTEAQGNAAEAQLRVVQAKLEGARAVLKEAEIALQDCALKTPMNAVLLKRNIQVGTLVGIGTVGFVLADTTSIKVVFGVPDLTVQNLKLGSSQTITTEAIRNTVFRGQITRISPSADPKSRVFEVEVTIPNPDNQLKVGMIAALEVAEAKASEPVMVIPLTAIVRPAGGSSDGYAVLIVEEQDGKQIARVRKVKLGEAFGNTIAVTEGVKVGERVITTGATLVGDGEQVQVIPQGSSD
jgi:multidrug efflux system membrane fusion protein